MRVAILHYHLKRGGVTRVIGSALEALGAAAEPIDTVVLAGEVPPGLDFADRCREVPGLRYSNAQTTTPRPEELLAALRSAAHSALGGPPDVWHIHNHSLGKNSSMPGVVAGLARDGDRLLLQMHDLAEDGRPENHRLNQGSGAPLYPTGDHIHYACINGRDTARFQKLGCSPLHNLPNPVEAAAGPTPAATSQAIRAELGCERLLLYPVRAVRRKNFGELLLWSCCLQPGEALATTLGPTNRNFEAGYQHWCELAETLDLPVHFGLGERYDWPFPALVKTASAIVTTSIAEGFGLAYLEPWLFGKVILGRDLPAITDDFRAVGVRLDPLYPALPIPEDWIDVPALRDKLASALRDAYTTYGRQLPADGVERALAGITPAPGMIDFGGLDETLQTDIIRRAAADSAAAAYLRAQFYAHGDPDPDSLADNAERILQNFHPQAYGQRLASIYRELVAAAPSPIGTLDPNQVLEQYLQPEDFRLLRT